MLPTRFTTHNIRPLRARHNWDDCIIRCVIFRKPRPGCQWRCRSSKPRAAPSTKRRRSNVRDDHLTSANTQEKHDLESRAFQRIQRVVLPYLTKSRQQSDQKEDDVKQLAHNLTAQLARDASSQDHIEPEALRTLLTSSSSLSPEVFQGLAESLLVAPNVECRMAGMRIITSLSQAGFIHSSVALLCSWLNTSTSWPRTFEHGRMRAAVTQILAYFTEHDELVADALRMDRADAKRLASMVYNRLGDHDESLELMDGAWQLSKKRGFEKSSTRSHDQIAGRTGISPSQRLAVPFWNDVYDIYLAAYNRTMSFRNNQQNTSQQQAGAHQLRQKMEDVLCVGTSFDDAAAHSRAAQFHQLAHVVEPVSATTKRNAADKHSDFLRHVVSRFAAMQQDRPESTVTSEATAGVNNWLYHTTKSAISGAPQAAHDLGRFYEGLSLTESRDYNTTTHDTPPQGLREKIHGLLHAVGIFGAQRSQPEHVTKLSAITTQPDQAAKIAVEWYKTAARWYFAPSHLALARLRIDNVVCDGDGVLHRRTHEDHRRRGNLQDSIEQLLRDCIGAAEAQRKYLDAARRNSAQEQASSNDFNVRKWSLIQQVMQLWIDDCSPYFEDMTATTTALCKRYQHDLYGDDGALLYRHDG